MNLLHLQYFYTVAKEDGFTNASKALRIQQPSISRLVRQLEDSLGFKLFEKVGRKVQLTKQGQDVFESCKRIFGEVDKLKISIGEIGKVCRGPLLIAAAETIASDFLPNKIRNLIGKHSLIYPNIFSGPASMMLDKVVNGELELGIFFHIPDLPEKVEIFEKIPFRYHLVVRKDLKKNLDIMQSFIGSREIDDISTRRFPTIERMKRDYPKTTIRISSNNLTAHRRMVLEGLGVSVLPNFLIEDDLRAGHLVDVYPKEIFEFNMKFIKRKASVVSLNVSELLKVCMQK